MRFDRWLLELARVSAWSAFLDRMVGALEGILEIFDGVSRFKPELPKPPIETQRQYGRLMAGIRLWDRGQELIGKLRNFDAPGFLLLPSVLQPRTVGDHAVRSVPATRRRSPCAKLGWQVEDQPPNRGAYLAGVKHGQAPPGAGGASVGNSRPTCNAITGQAAGPGFGALGPRSGPKEIPPPWVYT